VVVIRECRVCQSPHLIDYTKMKERGYTAKDIWRESRRREEIIPYRSFTRHFKYCWKLKKEFLFRESTDLAKEIVAKKFVEQMKIIEEMGNSLLILKEHLDQIREEMKLGSADWRNLLASLAEIRMSLKFLWDISQKIEIKPEVSLDELKDKLRTALRDIPYEYVTKIEAALNL